MTSIGCQTITWGPDRLFEDYIGVLHEVQEIGYAGVETNIRVLQKFADAVKSFLRQSNLVIVTGHTNVADLRRGDERDIESTLDMLHQLNVRFLLTSSPSSSTAEDFKSYAEVLNQVGEKAADRDIQVCFHNHNWELASNAALLNIVVNETNPSYVGLATDLGWVMRSNTDVETFVTKYASRIKYVHLKDVAGGEWTELGNGDLPLSNVLPIIKRLNLPWWIIEQDTTQKVPKTSALESFKYLEQHV